MASRKPKYKYPLVEILWIDAETGHGWEEETEIDVVLPPATTIGFLLKETEDALIIASTISGSSSNSRIKIPKGMTKSVVTLK